RKATSIQRHERTQFRRNYRDHLNHHPLRTVFNAGASFTERLNHFQALKRLGLALLRSISSRLMAKFVRKRIELRTRQEHFKGLGPLLGDKLLRIVVVDLLNLPWEFINDIEVFYFAAQIKSVDTVLLFHSRLN